MALGLGPAAGNQAVFDVLRRNKLDAQDSAIANERIAASQQQRQFETEDRAAAQQAQAGQQQWLTEALGLINGDETLTPRQKLAANIMLRQGKVPDFMQQAVKEHTVQLQRFGNELVDVNDPKNAGRQLSPETPKAQPQTVRTKDGIKVIDLQQSIGQTFEPEPDKPSGSGQEQLYPVQTVDEQGNPITQYLPRSAVAGQTFRKPAAGAGAVLPAALREAQVQSQNALGMLSDLNTQFAGVSKRLGPLAGRIAEASLQVPGVAVDKGFAKFSAATAALKNAVIKATTGAGMSNEEAKRIISQIPVAEDKPEVWQAKYEQSVTNLNRLLDIIQQQGGGAPATGGGGAPQPKATHRYVPGQGIVAIGGGTP